MYLQYQKSYLVLRHYTVLIMDVLIIHLVTLYPNIILKCVGICGNSVCTIYVDNRENVRIAGENVD